MVTYNSGAYIREGIESILNQSYSNFEFIICDDCSSDNTWQIIQSYNDPRIKAFRNNINIGEYPNRNKAVDLATGEYVIFIDGDDTMYHHALGTIAYYIGRFSDCGMILLREWDPRIRYPFLANPETIFRFEFLDTSIIGGNFTKVMFKKKAIVEAGYFPAHIRTGDNYIQVKIALHYDALAISDGLTWWRKRKGNASDTLMKDSKYMAEIINYRMALLNDKDCPLNETDKVTAKTNIYGIYIRILIRLLLKFRFKELAYLWKQIPVPREYYKVLYVRSKLDYFNTYSGDNPLHTPVKN